MTIKLLVADDSVTMQKVVRLAFSDDDVVVESAQSGDLALEIAKAFKPDIVLADVFMPGRNGYEVCESIKEDPELAGTPVILLVGSFEPFDELEASRVKCDAYLTKPFDTSELIEKVYELADKSAAPPEDKLTSQDATALPLDSETAIRQMSAQSMVSSRAWDSFLGPNQVLELFDRDVLARVKIRGVRRLDLEGGPSAAANAFPADALEGKPSEDFIKCIVDKVVQQMTPDIIREVAWEVIPELSEVLIRRVIEEQQKSSQFTRTAADRPPVVVPLFKLET